MEFDETGTWSTEPIQNLVGAHCKNLNAGTENWFLKVSSGCGASVSDDRYYMLQSS